MGEKESWKGTKPITKEEVERMAALQKQPIDPESLIHDGLLVEGGAWWAVPDMSKLPEHVSVKISEVKVEKGRTLIKLRMPRKR